MRPRWIFLIAFALVFYGTGAAVIESFVNYSSWHLIGPDEFLAYHRFISPRVLTLLVAPLLCGTAFTILMLWSRPARIPVWSVWAAIAVQAVVWISTVGVTSAALPSWPPEAREASHCRCLWADVADHTQPEHDTVRRVRPARCPE